MRLTIHIAAMADTVDAYDANFVGNFVNYADAPVVLAPSQFSATRRARVSRERSNRRHDTIVDLQGES